MTVTVIPEKFQMVNYSSEAIARVAQTLLDQIGLGSADLTITVDETTPLGRIRTTSFDPIAVEIESGAIEDPKRPRQLSEVGVADVLGRALLAAADRRRPEFAEAPADADLGLPYSVAWAIYCNGRLERLGYHPQRQRWLYHFRNRHGFTDTADAAFAKLWAGPTFTWAEIAAISDAARTTTPVG